MTVGEQPQSITGMQARLLRCLHAPPAAGGDAPKAVERVVGDEQEGAMRLASRLEERAVLLVLDDVWVDEHAKLFAVLPQVGRGGSLVVLTTRTPALLGATVAGKGVSEQRATDATVLAREYVLGTFSDSDGEALLSAAPSARTWDPLTKQVSTALLEVLDRYDSAFFDCSNPTTVPLLYIEHAVRCIGCHWQFRLWQAQSVAAAMGHRPAGLTYWQL